MEQLLGLISTIFPLAEMQLPFMQKAMLGLVLLAPLTAMVGVQAINFRMAFFTDAISHTSLAGVAIGVIFSISPYWTMPVFGVLISAAIVYSKRNSFLSLDTVIGVILSAVVAFGIAIVSRNPGLGKMVLRFIYGDVLTLSNNDILFLFLLLIAMVAFQIYAFNKMLYAGMDSLVAEVHGVNVTLFQYLYAAFLSVTVIFCVWWCGILIVTGMIIVPAAAARNMSCSIGAMFWWAIVISLISSISGLLISAQQWAGTATGATVVLVAFVLFVLSFIFKKAVSGRKTF
ncbi:MAG: metal ABC transporter permease [Gammaproteobacteria bacterium]|nr:MAG: metal ABC transporter permease [Gammaproteobacteria bacterium]